jgi:hypothetical protein
MLKILFGNAQLAQNYLHHDCYSNNTEIVSVTDKNFSKKSITYQIDGRNL